MKKASRVILIGFLLAVFFAPEVKAQPVNPVNFDASYLVDVDEGAETFCVLSSPNKPFQVADKIQAAASLTVTAVSGAPFLNVAVGDQLLVTQGGTGADAGTAYRLVVATRASSTSITVAGINNATGAMFASVTLTNASFVYRRRSCGTGINDGVIDLSLIRNKVLEIYISQSSLSSGNLQARVQCRTSQGSPWVQMIPSVTPPSVTATYYGYATGVLGFFAATTIDGFMQCRVGGSLSGTDTGAADYLSVSISGIS